jgi:flagellar hook-associated protein 2
MSNQLRITGMASGLDVESMVKQLMTAEKTKVDKLSQNRQIVQWKQDLYRDLIGEINTFKSTYFDVLKPDNYMLSSKNYSSFDISTTSSTGGATTALAAIAGSGAVAGLYKIRVDSLAQKAKFEGVSLSNSKEASSKIEFPIVIDSNNNKLTVDNKEVIITNKTYNNVIELASEINSKMATVDIGDNKKLTDSVQAIAKDGKVIFEKKITLDVSNNSFTLTSDGKTYTIQINEGSYTMEGIASQINSKLASLTDENGNKFPQYKKVASLDGKNLVFINENGTETSDATDSIADTITDALDVAVSSTSPGTSNTVSVPLINSNILEYDKKIFSGINDTLTVRAGGIVKNLALSTVLNGTTDTAGIASKLDAALSDVGIDVGISQDGKFIFTSNNTQQVTISGNATKMLGLSSSFEVNQSTSAIQSQWSNFQL